MKTIETPYITYGLGYEEDESMVDGESYYEDVLDLAEYFIQKYPKERYSIMHQMFMIGFKCGQRLEIVTNEVPGNGN